MEFRDLKNFMSVAQEGSFTKAANALFVSQPSLSKSVKRLEDSLQVALLERSTRFVQLTDAGEVVYAQCKKAFSTLDEITTLLDDLREAQVGTVKIGIPPLVGTLFFPGIARRFHESYPNVQLELTEVGAKLIWQHVDSGHVNVGFVVLPTNDELFHVKPFMEDEFVLFVHETHPLAQKKVVSIKELKEEKFVLFTDDFTLHDLVMQECMKAGFLANVVYKSSQWDLIVELVASNLGITLLPRSIYEKQMNPQVRAIELEERVLWRLAIITKKEVYMPYAVKEFLAFTEQLFIH